MTDKMQLIDTLHALKLIPLSSVLCHYFKW